MPTTTRRRRIAAHRQAVWDLVSDPHHLARWWPRVRRVEDVSGGGWTKVFVTAKGRTVRADYELVDSRAPERVAWRQELEDSPFERLLDDAVTEVSLVEEGAATDVTITLRQKLRGFARFAPFLVRVATRRLLDEALDGLERCLAR
jgi:uncharacterized protein YndB with AHSA1/START domain